MLNTAMLLAALYYLLYKPVRKFLKGREDKIAGQLDGALAREQESLKLLDQRKLQLDSAASEVADLIRTGETRGKARADELVLLAQQEARRIAEKSKVDIDSMQAGAQEELYERAANLSVDIAQMVLEREVTAADHQRLLKEFLEKAGREA